MPSADRTWNDAPSDCAREPIHAPGAIQPYGVLLVLDPLTLVVRECAVSQPIALRQFGDPLMQHVENALGGVIGPFVHRLRHIAPGGTLHLGAVHLDGLGRHQLLAHRSNEDLLIELEAPVAGQPGSLEELYPAIRELMLAIEGCDGGGSLPAGRRTHAQDRRIRPHAGLPVRCRLEWNRRRRRWQRHPAFVS